MSGHHPGQSAVRFGIFEVDRGSGELRKRGVRIKLQEQPLKILMLLLDRPGEIVTREQLRQIYGQREPLLTLSIVSMQRLPNCASRWAIRPRIPGSLRRFLAVDTAL